jgi:peptidoglycan/xylan/chitin deacetylase (PgdA/CDA1 family)
MATFFYRLMGAAMLDGGTYEQIENDHRHATWQAILIVVLASLAAGYGARLQVWAGPGAFVRVALISLVIWMAWAVLTLQIGSRVLPERETHADTGEMLRTIGFAAAPGVLLAFGAIPGATLPVFVIATIWMFAAMVVAIRHALDYSTIGRALAVCAAAAIVIALFTAGLGMLFSQTVSGTQAARAPNELGRIPILEYHKIDQPEARWTRTPDHFRADLERLWTLGYRSVALLDVLAGRIALPAGTSPVVFTFDDSSPGQFRFIQQGSDWTIDPDCAVGILEAFARKHPEFGHAATFYVLPGADPPNKLFNQPALVSRKLQYLASHGYEIGSHTLWHADLAKYDERTVRAQLARAQKEVARSVPGYTLRTLALPHGSYPKVLDWAVKGASDGVSYAHDAILMVAGGTAPSPYDRLFDATHLPRIQALDADLTRWLAETERHPERRFVSDGSDKTITVLRADAARVKPSLASHVVER